MPLNDRELCVVARNLYEACLEVVTVMDRRLREMGWDSVEEYQSVHPGPDDWYFKARSAMKEYEEGVIP